MRVKLFTRDKYFVEDIVTLPFKCMPEVIIWGTRTFQQCKELTTEQYFAYIECFCYFHVDFQLPGD